MLRNNRSQEYDVLLLLTDDTFIYHFKNKNTIPLFLGRERFGSLSDALSKIPKNRKLYIISSGEHFFEDEIVLPFALKNEKVLRVLVDEQLEKNPSIDEKIIYHFHPIQSYDDTLNSKYYVFGFGTAEHHRLEDAIANFTNVELVTSSRQALYCYIKDSIGKDEPFIAVYRLFDLEIMVASDGKELIFSRVHKYSAEQATEDLSRSLNYVIQRFKNMVFKIYLGGTFTTSKTLEDMLIAAYPVTVESLPADEAFPQIVKGAFCVSENYNFIPKRIQAIRLFKNVSGFLATALGAMTLFFTAMFLISLGEYANVREDYNQLHERYQTQLAGLQQEKHKALDLQEKIAALKKASSDQRLHELLRALKPLESLILRRFTWSKADTDIFEMTFSNAFESLEKFYAFEKVLDVFEKDFKKSYPRAMLIRTYDLEHLQVNVKIQQTKKANRRSRLGRTHG